MARRDPLLAGKVRDRINKWDKYWRINRVQYHEYTNFIMGDQWREDESRLFTRYNKIPLTFNKLGALMNHLLGDQMQNTPNLQIQPTQNVPEKTAEVRAALIKEISLSSNAKDKYQTAFGQAIVGGYGAYRLGTDYENDHSFFQHILIEDFTDPTRCYWDVSSKHKCKIDGLGSGFRETISRPLFRSLYGRKIEQAIGSTSLTEDSALALADDDSITLIYDYERKANTTTLYQLSDAKRTTVDSEGLKNLEKIELDGQEMLMLEGAPVVIVDQRKVPRYRVKHRLIAGDYILEETDFPSESLPIVFVDQKSFYDQKGMQICRPFFQDVKDAQRFLNYLATQTAYLFKVSRYDQYMAPRKAVSAPDTQQIWRDPSAQQGALVYDETPSGAKPEQLRPPELSASLMQHYERVLMDIQSGTGMYNAQIGERGNEVSGKAMDRRINQGSYNTYVPRNSLNIAIACGGEIINEMIPKVYDVERELMLAMPDRENEPVKINSPKDDYGDELENDMTQGRYKIRLVPGQSYEGQKTDAAESMQMILQNDPSLFRLIGDLYVENLPMANNIELRNRIRTIIPPAVIEAGKSGKPMQQQNNQPTPDQLLAEAKIKDMQQKTELKMKEIELKQADLQRKALETNQSMTMEWQTLETQKEEAAAKLQEQILRYQAEMHKTDSDMQIAHANNLVKILTHGKALTEKENR